MTTYYMSTSQYWQSNLSVVSISSVDINDYRLCVDLDIVTNKPNSKPVVSISSVDINDYKLCVDLDNYVDIAVASFLCY